MFSFFKNKTKTVGMNVSPWLLDEEAGEIRKDMFVYRGGEIEKRIQVSYAVQDVSGIGFDMSSLLPGLPSSLSKSQHFSVLYSPCLGLGDGFMEARIGNAVDDNENIKLVEPIVSVVEISDHPDKGFTLILFTGRMAVIQTADLISKGDDVAFKLYGNPENTLYLSFPIPNEPGFGQLRETLLR